MGPNFSHATHHEMWEAWWTEVVRHGHMVRVLPVKAHNSIEEAEWLLIAPRDYIGNFLADALAEQIATTIQASSAEVIKVRRHDDSGSMIRNRISQAVLAAIQIDEDIAREAGHSEGHRTTGHGGRKQHDDVGQRRRPNQAAGTVTSCVIGRIAMGSAKWFAPRASSS